MRGLVYIAAGVAGGWLFGKLLFDSSPRRNPEWRLDWLDDDGEPSKAESNVWVGDEKIGSILDTYVSGWMPYNFKDQPMQSVEAMRAEQAAQSVFEFWQQEKAPKEPFKIEWEVPHQEGNVSADRRFIGTVTRTESGDWAAYEGSQIDPFMEDFSSAKKAAAAVYRRWAGLPEPLPEPTTVEVAVPSWVKNIEVEPTVGAGENRFIVWVGDDRAGVIERRGRAYDAYFWVGKKKLQLEIGTTRKRAVTSVYVAHQLMGYLARSFVKGKKRRFVPPKYKTLPKKKGQRARRVEQFWRMKHYKERSPAEVKADTGIPEKEIVRYGLQLAGRNLIYAVATSEKRTSFQRIEKGAERVIAGRGHRPEVRRKRRIVERPDIKKLRKSTQLTTEQKKLLPMMSTKRTYRFAMVGPQGQVGMVKSEHHAEVWGKE
jgi:hypothetical protein